MPEVAGSGPVAPALGSDGATSHASRRKRDQIAGGSRRGGGSQLSFTAGCWRITGLDRLLLRIEDVADRTRAEAGRADPLLRERAVVRAR
jgi:hypothetical protein